MSSIDFGRSWCRRAVAWFAMAAMMFHSLWPALAAAQRPGISSAFEVCTAQGLRPVTAGLNEPGRHDPATGSVTVHCALCGSGSVDLPALHQAGLVVSGATVSDAAMGSATRRVPHIRVVRSATHPRDPPVMS